MNADFYLQDLKTKFKKINSDEYFLSYSGGRDSHFLYWFIKEYLHDDKIKIVSVNTYMEHPQILKRIRENADTILYPTMKPFEVKEKYGSPCFSKFQDEMIDRYQRGSRAPYLMERVNGVYEDGTKVVGRFRLNNTAREKLLDGTLHRVSSNCCTYLKKQPMHEYEKQTGKHAIIAMRSSEGALRKNINTCFHKNGNFTPIHDLTDELLREIEQKYNIEVPEIYDHIQRTGCMGCPYGSWKHDTEKELALVTPAQRKFLGEYFKESYEVLGIPIEQIKIQCGDYLLNGNAYEWEETE